MPEASPATRAWKADIRARLSGLRLSPERESEIVEELAQHLEDRSRELIAGGMEPDAAARAALADFRDGNVLAQYMAPLRQANAPTPIVPGTPARVRPRLFADLRQDIRYALRTMAARPGFTAMAVLSLALGIGADTAIFSLWNGVLRASLAGVREPGRLVMLTNPDETGSWTGRVDGPRSWLTWSEFQDLRAHAGGFSGLMASQSSLNTWEVRVDGGELERATARLVSGGYFQVLGVGSAIGRVFTEDADRADLPEAVISDAYWQRRFGGGDVIGRTIAIRKTVVTIVGVAARGFAGETSGQRPDVWLPVRLQPQLIPGRDRLHDTPPEKSMWLHVFGRLAPGVTPQQAEAQTNRVFQAGLESFYGAEAAGPRRRELLDQRLQVRAGGMGASSTRSAFSQSLTALLAAVALLLLIACANLANLLLARGAARRSEFALRLSLGASRERLVRQLVTESLTLAAFGGVAAVAVAYGMHGVLVRMLARTDENFQMTFGANPLVLAFLAVVTIGAALLFGALPAWQSTKFDGRTIGSRQQLRSGRWLVTAQLALSLPLLVGAGLLARTAHNLQRADLGYPAERLLLVRVDPRAGGYDEGARREQWLRDASAAIRRLPGVKAVSYSQLGIFTGGEATASVEVDGYVKKGDAAPESSFDTVGPGYFAALGAPIRLGRDTTDADMTGATNVCVVNEAFAKTFFGPRNPIGLHVAMTREDGGTSYEVVGVAGNARTQALRGDVDPRFYVTRRPSQSSGSPTFLIRTAADPAALQMSVRVAIRAVDEAVPIVSAKTIEERMEPLTAQDRTTAQLAAVFAAVALALAALGLYGVLSHGIARRTGEIAIRIALGARAGRVVAMILGETMVVIAVGLAIGGGLAWAATRAIGSRLYGVEPQDPTTIAFAIALLLAVALAAAYGPARRASRVSPMAALRQY